MRCAFMRKSREKNKLNEFSEKPRGKNVGSMSCNQRPRRSTNGGQLVQSRPPATPSHRGRETVRRKWSYCPAWARCTNAETAASKTTTYRDRKLIRPESTNVLRKNEKARDLKACASSRCLGDGRAKGDAVDKARHCGS